MILLFVAVVADSQQVWTVYNTVNSPIPDNGINALYIDSLNHKWVGTANGLTVYDDATWTQYNTLNSGLSGDLVKAIARDRSGNMWFGTQDGLNKFDGTNWTHWNMANSNLPADMVQCIAFDTAGKTWCGTNNGLARLDSGTTFTFWNVNNSVLVSGNITSIAIGPDNIKCFGALNQGLAYYNDTTFTIYNNINSSLQDNSILAVLRDTLGTMWVGTPGKALQAHYPDTTWGWWCPTNSSCPTWTVNCIYIDSVPNTKYLGGQVAGLVKWDGANSWNYWSTFNSGIPDNNVMSIAHDHNGFYWVGTSNGLAKFDENLWLGMAKRDLSVGTNIYPNPALDFISINISVSSNTKYNLKIYDVFGRIFWEKQGVDKKELSYISLTNFKDGIYFCELRGVDGTTALKKFVVQ